MLMIHLDKADKGPCSQRHDVHCNNHHACQPRLGACGASLSSPGRLVLSDLVRAGNGQMVNVRQDHIVPNLLRLANMAWTFDLAKQHALCADHTAQSLDVHCVQIIQH